MKATIMDLRKFNAVQHFAYYINVEHLRDTAPWGQHLTDHFLSKLLAATSREDKGYITVGVVINWMQEMTTNNQHTLLNYIYENHMDKYASDLKNQDDS